MSNSNMNFPNTDGLLPSEEHRVVTKYIYDRICAAPLNYRNEPTYRYLNVLHDTQHLVCGSYTSSIIHTCYLRALEQFKADRKKL